jgi:hypothetical protein
VRLSLDILQVKFVLTFLGFNFLAGWNVFTYFRGIAPVDLVCTVVDDDQLFEPHGHLDLTRYHDSIVDQLDVVEDIEKTHFEFSVEGIDLK